MSLISEKNKPNLKRKYIYSVDNFLSREDILKKIHKKKDSSVIRLFTIFKY